VYGHIFTTFVAKLRSDMVKIPNFTRGWWGGESPLYILNLKYEVRIPRVKSLLWWWGRGGRLKYCKTLSISSIIQFHPNGSAA
jgi:hypothetical protein